MDVESLAKQLILKGMTEEQQTAVLDSIKSTMLQARSVQKQRVGENVQVVVQSLKKIEADLRGEYSDVADKLAKRIAAIKDGKDGQNGINGKDGRDGRPGRDGATGPKGANGLDGRNGIDGKDGVSVTNAYIDFDGSLVINLSDGQVLNVGEVVSQDLADKIQVISTMSTNGAVGIRDEGSSISTGVKNINFVGATVTATASGDDVTVNVSAGTGSVTSVAATAGTGISVTGSPITTSGTLNITNTAPDQVVSLTGSGATTVTGTYPNFTIASTGGGTVTSVAATAGTGISITGSPITTSGTIDIVNTAPDQIVSLTGAGTTSISGTYPNFTITSADSTVGTVTSVGGTGTVSGISLSGTVTSSGNVTLGGTLDLSSPPTIGNTAPNTGRFTTLTVNDNTTLGTSNTDTVTFTARVDSEFSPATDNTFDLGRTGHEWRNLFIDGTANIDSLVADTADINGGTIDGATIGGASAAAATVTTLNTSGLVVFNDAGADVDFRVEGDTNANLLFVDASADAVGIGTNTPAVLAHVQSTTATTNAVTQVLRLDSQSSGTPANGIGVGMQFSTETAAGNTEIGATIEAITTDVTSTAENFDLSFKTMAAGAAAVERVRLKSTGDFQFDSGFGSVATAYACRAWVNFNGASNGNLTGTYSQTGTTVTVSITAHGYISGNIAELDFTSGTAVDGTYTVTVVDANTFEVTQASRTTSGNVTNIRNVITASGNVSSITDLQTGQYIINFITAMPDANYAAAGAGPEISEVVSFRSYTSFPPTTTSARITLRTSNTAAAVDRNGISFMIFR